MQNLILGANHNNRTGTSTTLNPSDKASSVVLSNGNLTATMSSGGAVRSTRAYSSGRHMFEVTLVQYEQGLYSPLVGICTSATALTQPWTTTGEYLLYNTGSSTTIIYGANNRFNYGAVLSAGNVIGVTVDFTGSNPILGFYRNGAYMGSTSQAGTIPVASYYAMVSSPNGPSGTSITAVNFGNTSFQYPITNFTVW